MRTFRFRPGLAEALRRRHSIVDRRGKVAYLDPVLLPERRHTVTVPCWVNLDPDGGETPFAGPVGYWCPGQRGYPARRGEAVHLYLGRYADDDRPAFVRVFCRDNVPVAWAMGAEQQINDHRYELVRVRTAEINPEALP
jgi:hypothetical protein